MFDTNGVDDSIASRMNSVSPPSTKLRFTKTVRARSATRRPTGKEPRMFEIDPATHGKGVSKQGGTNA